MKETTIQKIKNCFNSIDDEEIEYFIIAKGDDDESCIRMHGDKKIRRILTELMIGVPPFRRFMLSVVKNYLSEIKAKREKENKTEDNKNFS